MSTAPVPPRFLPTLTDVVLPETVVVHRPANTVNNVNTASPASMVQGADVFEEQMVHRVMQRIDLVLERRLREAVGQLILAHTQALGPRLREEIELVVRESVSQAVAQELPPERPPSGV